jgi:energy-coupling factor transporter ATP-binding protein EcfA2
MVEETESPRLMHVWTAIGTIAGALGRRCWLPFGQKEIFPNQYIVLVGNPGSRKSSALSVGKGLLRDTTKVRFAPSDTGGQRQGLIAALMPPPEKNKEALNGVEIAAKDRTFSFSLESFAELDNTPTAEDVTRDADQHAICVVASEFTTLLGQNNQGLIDFLTATYDGDEVEYKLKSETIKIADPLISLMGATTPTSISTSLPAASVGQGFMSRVILVYGRDKYKSIAWPQPFQKDVEDQVRQVVSRAYYELEGEFSQTPEAQAYSTELYDNYVLDITDSRFQYYGERRFTHLIKLAMALTAMRGSMLIVRDDYVEAHQILRATERGMPDALGEFGLNPVAVVKQGILDFLRACAQPVGADIIRATFHRDAKSRDIQECLSDLVAAGQVKALQTQTGAVLFAAVLKLDKTNDEMLNLLAQR